VVDFFTDRLFLLNPRILLRYLTLKLFFADLLTRRLVIFILALDALLLVGTAFAGRYEWKVDSSAIAPERGYAFVIHLRKVTGLPAFLMPYDDSEHPTVGPSREHFDGPAIADHFRWHLGTDFSIVFNLAVQLRGVMVLAAIGLLAILLPFSRNAIPLCLGILSAVIAYAAMISLVTIYVPRYGLPVDLSALFAILVAIIGVYDTRFPSSACDRQGTR
jgi:hypothetical protein